jgi:alpha-glucosidase (family GH31 glycosyl hydrolase)
MWWDYWTNQKYSGPQTITRPVDLETIPLYVRGGSVVPTGAVKQWAYEPSIDPVTLNIYPGVDGVSSLYEDDGISYACERGDFTRTELLWDDHARSLTLRSNRRATERKFKVILEGSSKGIAFTGKESTFRLD